MSLLESIKEKASKLNKRIVLAEGEEERIIRAAESITRQKIARITLIGRPDVIAKKCPDVNLDGVDILNPDASDLTEYSELLYELRKAKGL